MKVSVCMQDGKWQYCEQVALSSRFTERLSPKILSLELPVKTSSKVARQVNIDPTMNLLHSRTPCV